ncbi:DUF6777 domain-containing protein [Streptomyces sp. NPDC007084]|uniref:DUF6777 domain-containing protein n=1 Tax=Streptomyces sp. NPDC007084 TaxID=3154313 RepID=UPI0034519123
MVRIPTRPLVTGGALAAVLLLAACGGGHDRDTPTNGPDDAEVLLQPVSEHGPDPFTASTVTSTGTPPSVTRTPQPKDSGDEGPRAYSGATPGLYGGTRNTGSCDVERQVRALAADPARTRAFAQSSGIDPGSVPDYLRELTSVLLRADTRVTNHGFRDGQATSFPSVLQAGTAVLVDDRGVPRVRCACGNPLGRPTGTDADPATRGRPWSGYRPARVVVVTPAPVVITDLTILDVTAGTWIGRPVGQDGPRHDRPVHRPGEATPTDHPDTSPSHPDTSPSRRDTSPSHPDTSPSAHASSPGPHASSPGPHDSSPAPRDSAGGTATGSAPREEDEATPAPDGSAEDCGSPSPTPTGPPETGEATPEESAGSGTGPAATPPEDSVMDVSRHDRRSSSDRPSRGAPLSGSAPSSGSDRAARRDDPAGCPTATREPSDPSEPAEPSTGPGTPTEDTTPDLPDLPDVPDLPGDGGLVPVQPDPGESVLDVSAGVFAG